MTSLMIFLANGALLSMFSVADRDLLQGQSGSQAVIRNEDSSPLGISEACRASQRGQSRTPQLGKGTGASEGQGRGSERPHAEEQQELEQLNSRWFKAYERRDSKALEEILADDFVGNYFGHARSKAQIIASTLDPRRNVKEISWKDLQIRSNGNMAVVSGISTTRLQLGAEPETISSTRYIDIYERRSGCWQAVAAHVSPVSN